VRLWQSGAHGNGQSDMSIEAAVVGIVDRVDITDSVSEEMREAAVKLARDNGRR